MSLIVLCPHQSSPHAQDCMYNINSEILSRLRDIIFYYDADSTADIILYTAYIVHAYKSRHINNIITNQQNRHRRKLSQCSQQVYVGRSEEERRDSYTCKHR